MNESSLATKIKSNFQGLGIEINDDRYIKALAKAIIEEIQQNGTVNFSNVSSIISPSGNCSGFLSNGKIS